MSEFHTSTGNPHGGPDGAIFYMFNIRKKNGGEAAITASDDDRQYRHPEQ